jgi:hypothetical protein
MKIPQKFQPEILFKDYMTLILFPLGQARMISSTYTNKITAEAL